MFCRHWLLRNRKTGDLVAGYSDQMDVEGPPKHTLTTQRHLPLSFAKDAANKAFDGAQHTSLIFHLRNLCRHAADVLPGKLKSDGLAYFL